MAKKEKKAKILVGTNKSIAITESEKKSSCRIYRACLSFRQNRARQISLQFDPNCAGTKPIFANKTNCHLAHKQQYDDFYSILPQTLCVGLKYAKHISVYSDPVYKGLLLNRLFQIVRNVEDICFTNI